MDGTPHWHTATATLPTAKVVKPCIRAERLSNSVHTGQAEWLALFYQGIPLRQWQDQLPKMLVAMQHVGAFGRLGSFFPCPAPLHPVVLQSLCLRLPTPV
jgi:hypothetical protein